MFKVCIADDEEYVLESVRQRIQQSGLGLEVTGVAGNGLEAYDLYEKETPDIYFVDINMPLCNGLDFVERVRMLDKDSTTKFIIISGYDDFKYMKKAIQTRVVNYILKPIQQQEFIDTLNGVCDSLKESKRRRMEEDQRQWVFFQDISGEKPDLTGTALLLYGKKIAERIRKTEESGFGDAAEIFSHEKWRYIRFHESSNLLLLFAEDLFLDECAICAIWEKISGCKDCYLVYRTGKKMDTETLMAELEAALNKRFWGGSLHMLEAGKLSKSAEEINLEGLSRAIEDLRGGKWQEELEFLLSEAFSDQGKREMLRGFYHSVLILAADKYRQHNFDIPENLKRELSPYSLNNCAGQEEVRDKIAAYIGFLHQKIVRESGKNDLAEQAAAYLDVHYTEEINLSDLANEFFVAPNYLAKRFKEKKNITVMQYLEHRRMEKAAELLQVTKLSVTEIAGLTGYNDANYFTRAFKKRYAISPREFRNGID